MNRRMGNKTKAAILTVVAIAVLAFAVPGHAWAAQVVSLQLLITQLQTLITVLILPISVLIAAWRIIYIAVFCGMMGIDPLNQVSDSDKDGQISSSEVTSAIKAHLGGFFNGLMWIGGLWIIFQIALTVAGYLAGALATSF